MPYPTLHDDGQTVTLDLHGIVVAEAEALARLVIEAAAQRGRSQVKVVHGASTSSQGYRNQTIKHQLHTMLDTGTLRPWVAHDWRAEGHLLLSLNITADADPTRLRLRDLWP